MISPVAADTEPDCRITLYQGIQKSGKFETVVQKGVELGVCALCPLAASGRWPSPERIDSRCAAIPRGSGGGEAVRPGIIPKVAPPISFDELCERAGKHELTLLLWEEERSAR